MFVNWLFACVLCCVSSSCVYFIENRRVGGYENDTRRVKEEKIEWSKFSERILLRCI
jgi:hypothetical protein